MDKMEVLFSKEQIEKRVKEVGEQISKDYKGKKLMVICVIKGAFIFTADLVRAIDLDLEIDFMKAKSYVGTESSGVVNISIDNELEVEGKDIIVVEDILDTGRTLHSICNTLRSKNANSVKVCVFLDKAERRVVDLKADYVCYDIPDTFVVGYGLDYDEKYRQLPFVGQIISE